MGRVMRVDGFAVFLIAWCNVWDAQATVAMESMQFGQIGWISGRIQVGSRWEYNGNTMGLQRDATGLQWDCNGITLRFGGRLMET